MGFVPGCFCAGISGTLGSSQSPRKPLQAPDGILLSSSSLVEMQMVLRGTALVKISYLKPVVNSGFCDLISKFLGASFNISGPQSLFL